MVGMKNECDVERAGRGVGRLDTVEHPQKVAGEADRFATGSPGVGTAAHFHWSQRAELTKANRAGDIFTVVAPVSPDATLANLAWAFVGSH